MCVGLVVFAGTFASACRAQDFWGNLDYAVLRLTQELLRNGMLQGDDKPPVLAHSQFFFESETRFRMPLSGLLSERFATEFGRHGVRIVRDGIDENDVRILHGRWRLRSEEWLYLRMFVTEALNRSSPNEVANADGVVVVDDRTMRDLEPTLAHSGRHLAQELDGHVRDRIRRTVYVRPLSVRGEQVVQTEEIRQELTNWLRNSLTDSRLFEFAEPLSSEPAAPMAVDGELLGEVYVGRQDIQVDLRVRDNRGHQVTTASVKLPRKLIEMEDPCASLFRAGGLPEAAECVVRAREHDPENTQTLALLARIAERYVERVEEAIRRGSFDEAQRDVRQLEELNGGHPRLLELEGKIARREMRDCDECPELVVVSSGGFMMGSPSDEVDRRGDEEDTAHRVTIAEPVAVGRYEVTFAEWDACVAGGGCNGYRPDDEGWGRGRQPVVHVSWEDARTYVRWLSRKTRKTYRLLSESEWEYVARAGTTTPFHHGGTISTEQANYDGRYTYGPGRKGEYRKQTVPVGTFRPNGFGLHDVHGNVWEWVEDCWHDSYRGAPSDGTAWTSGRKCGKRVMRGGSWFDEPKNLRSARRGYNKAGSRDHDVGFRIARELTP